MILTGKPEHVEDLGVYRVGGEVIIICYFKERVGGCRLDYSSSGCYKWSASVKTVVEFSYFIKCWYIFDWLRAC